MTLRALAISGSPRPQGNTVALLNHCLNRLKTHGIQTELVSLHDKDLHGCDGCGACGETKDGTCPSISDDFGLIYDQMLKAEILIVGSPVSGGLG